MQVWRSLRIRSMPATAAPSNPPPRRDPEPIMEQYKDLWISGHATPGYPGGNNLTPGATVSYQRPNNSVVELTTLNVHNFELENREVAELIGLQLARLIVDTCYPELQRERQEIEQKNDGKPDIALSTLIEIRGA